MKIKKFIFLAIVVLTFTLRFYKLGEVPASLNWDEAGMGYNAYSLIKTSGFDEYGQLLPLAFRSFDDYKPPFYTYLTVIPVYLLGLNDFAVRFPSAFFGSLTAVVLFLLVQELFSTSPTIRGASSGHLGGGTERIAFKTRSFQSKTGSFEATNLALLSSLFLAISPWHLQSSRVAFEVNVSVFLSVVGTWAFLKGVRENGKWLLISAVFFGLNLYTYHSARVFTPLLSATLVFLYRKELFSKLKYFFLSMLIAVIFLIPLASIVTSISGQMRFKGTAIFYQSEPLENLTRPIDQDEETGQEFIGRIFHDKRLAYFGVIGKNYLSHFRPEFLFFEADHPTHHAPNIGLLYLWDLPFIFLGVDYLFKKKLGRTTIVLMSWFLFGPIASSFTWQTPHALRSEVILPTHQIFIALGVYYLYEILKKKKNLIKPFCLTIFFLFLANFTYYLHQYYSHLNRDFSRDWNYGRKEAAEFVSKIENNYNKIIVSTNLDKAYMHFLYYLKYDPNEYLEEGGTVSGGFWEQQNKFGKYEFRQFDFNKERKKKDFLFIGEDNEFSPDAKVLRTIFYLDKKSAIKIIESS